MPIRAQLLKKWVGPDPEKHIGSTTPLHVIIDVIIFDVDMFCRYRRAEALGNKISLLTASDSNSRAVTSFTKAYVNPRLVMVGHLFIIFLFLPLIFHAVDQTSIVIFRSYVTAVHMV